MEFLKYAQNLKLLFPTSDEDVIPDSDDPVDPFSSIKEYL
jgi:hypothetical protein